VTPSDLQTCRAWCRANGVEVLNTEGTTFPWHAINLPAWFPPDDCGYGANFEYQAYAFVWRRLAPIIQSVRNLDAVEVEGPYEAYKYEELSNLWCVNGKGRLIGNLSEQTARTIAGILNRECGSGK